LTDPPELLALALVGHPAAARGLEEWMYEEQEESSPGSEHTSDLSDGRLKWIDMFERHTHHHRIEGRFSVRELLRPCVHIASRPASAVGGAN
jgi:hypothetical protein